ncbi:hypothetical protein LTR53_004716 [Teratosphaeriaceae sp. CCFEE 6253]|nr:hypothetical protein LTR53_004716 [Teratosphaeriaceae sp. CCFEE 6253]
MESSFLDEHPSHRACAHCRSQKIRCLPDERKPDTCSRCARSGRPCIFTPLQKRKQRKRTDTRVAELEREMRAMRALLNDKQQGKSGAAGSGKLAPGGRAGGLESGTAQALSTLVPPPQASVQQMQRTRTPSTSQWPGALFEHPCKAVSQDVVDRGLLTMATARQLVETYRTELFAHYPNVPITGDMTADDLRSKRPVLFLAVIAAASGKDDPDLSAALDKEVLEVYATKSLMHSEKSLELVQSLLTSAVWYHPPGKFGQLKYYEYIHIAVTMALDIGIGARPKAARQRFGNAVRGREPAKQAMAHPAEDASDPDLSMTPRSRDGSPDTGSLESRRTFVATYMICAGVSVSLRRPNILPISSYVRECIDYLDHSPNARPTDRILVHWVRLCVIAEEISVSFSYHDPGGTALISELKTQLMLKDFELRLTSWWRGVPEHEGNGSMTIMYYWVRLFLHEVVLHVDHSPDDFRAPYQMGPIRRLNGADIPTHVLAESIAEDISSSHALLNAFFAMDVDSLRALPIFSYVRISFAAFVLAKLCLSATRPESRICHVLDRKAIQAELYMDRAVLHVRNIVGDKRCRVPAIFLALLFKLRQWCLYPEMIEPSLHGETRPDLNSEMGVSKRPDGSKALESVPDDGGRGSSSSSDVDSPLSTVGQATGGAVTLGPRGAPYLPPSSFDHADDSSGKLSDSATNVALGDMQNPYIANGTATSGSQEDTPGDWAVPSIDAMQLDHEYMQYFGDMLDGFPTDGGLAGFDEWMTANLNIGDESGGMSAAETSVEASAKMFGYGWQNTG